MAMELGHALGTTPAAGSFTCNNHMMHTIVCRHLNLWQALCIQESRHLRVFFSGNSAVCAVFHLLDVLLFCRQINGGESYESLPPAVLHLNTSFGGGEWGECCCP